MEVIFIVAVEHVVQVGSQPIRERSEFFQVEGDLVIFFVSLVAVARPSSQSGCGQREEHIRAPSTLAL